MKKYFPVSLFLLLSTMIYGQNSISSKAQALLDDAISDGQFAGVAAGFSVDGQIAWTGSAGYSDQENDQKAEVDMLTRTASLAKPMTAICIMQLVERGLIDLDAPIQTYLPDYPKKPEGEITTRHLLQHSAGISGYKNAKERENKTGYASLKEVVDVFKDRDLLASPGEEFHYTSYGYVVLGLIIEQVSGMSYEAYIQKNIWDKCGMKNTSIERFGETYSNKSKLYHINKKGKIREVKQSNLSNRVPAGGFQTTITDILRFGEAVLNHSLISENSLSSMLVAPDIKNPGTSYGLGFGLYGEHPKYGNAFGHEGGQVGATTFLVFLPQEKTVIAVLANTSGAFKDVLRIALSMYDLAAEVK